MNSLYGRFGINPESLQSTLCNKAEYNRILHTPYYKDADQLADDRYLVHYFTNTSKTPDDLWDAPKNAAVHIAAAITASARIHMFKYISRQDCYYTDTDSIVIGEPLPDEEVSSTELGKLKLE